MMADLTGLLQLTQYDEVQDIVFTHIENLKI